MAPGITIVASGRNTSDPKAEKISFMRQPQRSGLWGGLNDYFSSTCEITVRTLVRAGAVFHGGGVKKMFFLDAPRLTRIQDAEKKRQMAPGVEKTRGAKYYSYE